MSNLSPAPGVPQSPTKAIWAGVAAFVGTFIFALWQAVADRTEVDTMTNTQWLIVLLGALATAVTTSGFAYQVRNRPR